MVSYTGKYFSLEKCAAFGGPVNVLEYVAADGAFHGTCFRCGRKLRRHWWVVQTADDDLEICELGEECVKKLA